MSEGRYQVRGVLGQGGLCVVERAWDTQSHQEIALKRLRPALRTDSKLCRRLRREGRALARLGDGHPGVVSLLDMGEDALGPYLAMELLAGITLRDFVPQRFEELLTVFDQLLAALAFTHARGIIHRDLKPENIRLFQDDGCPIVKLLDFGFAKVQDDIDDQLSAISQDVFGTPTYMAPELALGEREIGPSADLYSLSVMLWEVATGTPPFVGATETAVLIQHLNAPLPEFRPKFVCPEGLAALLSRGLAKEPLLRFDNAGELRRALAGLLEGEADTLVPPPQTSPPLDWLRAACVGVHQGKSLVRLVVGEEGQGKRTLCERLCTEERERGELWVLAARLRFDGALTPFAHAARRLLGLSERPSALTSSLFPAESQAIWEDLASFLWSTPAPISRQASAVAALLRRLADRRPVLVVLESLHRASPATMAWLRMLLSDLALNPAPVLWILTTRPGHPLVDRSLATALSVLPGVERLQLSGEATLRPSLRSERLDTLSPNARKLFAHLQGQDDGWTMPRLECLADALQLDGLEGLVDELLAGGLVVEESAGLALAWEAQGAPLHNPAIAARCWSAPSPAEPAFLAEFYKRLGDPLASQADMDAGEQALLANEAALAVGWFSEAERLAAPSLGPQAIAKLGRCALEVGAWEAALRQAERLERASRGDEDRLEAALLAGEAELGRGEVQSARLLRLEDELDQRSGELYRSARGRVALLLGRAALAAGDGARAARMLARAEAILPAREPARLRCLFSLGELAAREGDLRQADRMLCECETVAWQQGELSLAGRAALRRGELLRRLHQDACPAYRRAVLAFDARGAHLEATAALRALADAQKARGLPQALETYEWSAQRYEALGERTKLGFCLVQQGRLQHAQGEFASARRLFLQALEVLPAAQEPVRVGLVHAFLGVLALELGDLVEASHHRELAWEADRCHGLETVEWARALERLGRGLLERGELAEAKRHFVRAEAVYQGQSRHHDAARCRESALELAAKADA